MSSSGRRGTYSFLVHLDANQAISTMNSLETPLGSLGASFTQSNGAVAQTAQSFERYTQAAQTCHLPDL